MLTAMLPAMVAMVKSEGQQKLRNHFFPLLEVNPNTKRASGQVV
jgi:hypothetical protein